MRIKKHRKRRKRIKNNNPKRWLVSGCRWWARSNVKRIVMPRGVFIVFFNNRFDTEPNGDVVENLNYATMIGKRRFLQDRQVFHHAVMYNKLD